MNALRLGHKWWSMIGECAMARTLVVDGCLGLVSVLRLEHWWECWIG